MTSFLALANFKGERFSSKLVFGEATQVFHGALMDFVFAGVSYRAAHGSFSATLSLNHFQCLLHILAHGGIALWVSYCTLWESFS